MRCPEVGLELSLRFVFKCPEVRLGICLFAIARMMKPSIPKPTSGHLRFVRNSHSRCGCGGAQVFECVGGSMPRIERRRLTLDDRDDRRRDRVQRERPKVGLEFSNPISGRKKKQSDLRTQKENLTEDDVAKNSRSEDAKKSYRKRVPPRARKGSKSGRVRERQNSRFRRPSESSHFLIKVLFKM